jgi:transcriptional regulator with XRE-family HTH domain
MKRTKHNGKLTRTTTPAKKKSRPKKYKLPGRRGIYDESVPKRVFGLAKLGLTERQIAEALGISHGTMDNWKNKHPELLDALLAGKDLFDHGVQKSLLQRAMGYSYWEVKEETVVIKGKKFPKITRTKKQVVPDTTAIIFWLKNRHYTEWADVNKQEIHQVSDINVNKTLNLDTLEPEERELIRSIALKKLASTSGVSRN